MNNVKDPIVKRNMVPSCCDIYHGDEHVILKLEMPGVSKENLELKVVENLLTISGKKEHKPEDGKFLLREIRPKDYYQEFTLDNTIDKEHIEATIRNGVVTLILNLKESEKPRKIKINAE